MARLELFASVVLIIVSTLLTSGFSQEMPSLGISPAKVTMLQGETRTFRAVGKDGRIRHNVRWSISPEQAAKLTTTGDEAVVEVEASSSTLTLTANAESDSAKATIEILPGHTMPTGTVLWTVAPLPGCKSKNLTQAVPSANGPDLYDEEDCPQGQFIRALTADGRELWRRQLTGAGGILFGAPVTKPQADTGQHLNPHDTSVCDAIFTGMTKEDAGKVIDDRKLRLEEKQRASQHWVLEEEGFRCTILFDAASGTVFKKKKTVVTD